MADKEKATKIEHLAAMGIVMARFKVTTRDGRAKSYSYGSGSPMLEERARARAEGYLDGWEQGYAIGDAEGDLGVASEALKDVESALDALRQALRKAGCTV